MFCMASNLSNCVHAVRGGTMERAPRMAAWPTAQFAHCGKRMSDAVPSGTPLPTKRSRILLTAGLAA